MRFHGLEIRLDQQLQRIIRLGKLLIIILVLGEVFFGWGGSLKNVLQEGFARQRFFWQQEPQLNLLTAWFREGLLVVIGLPGLILLGAIFAGCRGRMGAKGQNQRFIGSYLKRAGLRLNLFNLKRMVSNLLLVGLILLLAQLLLAPYFTFTRELLYSLLWAFMGYCLLKETHFLACQWYSQRRIVREVDKRLGLKEALLTCIHISQQKQGKLQDYLNHQVLGRMKEQSPAQLFPCRTAIFSGNCLLRQLFLINLTALFFSMLLAPLIAGYVWESPVVAAATPQPELFTLAQQILQEGEEIGRVAAELEDLTQSKEEGLAAAAVELKQLGCELAMLSARSPQPRKPGKALPGSQTRLSLSEKEVQQLKEQTLSPQAAKRGNTRLPAEGETWLTGETLALAGELKSPLAVSSLGNTQFQTAALQQLKAALSTKASSIVEGVGAEGGQDYNQMQPASASPSLADAASLNQLKPQLQDLSARSARQEKQSNQSPAQRRQPEQALPKRQTPTPSPKVQRVASITQGRELQKILEELDKWQQELAQRLGKVKGKENQGEDPFEGGKGESPRQATVIKGEQDYQEQPETGKGKIRLSGQPEEDHYHRKVANLDPDNQEPNQPLPPDSKRAGVVAQTDLEGFNPNQPTSQVSAGKKREGKGEVPKGLKPDERELSGDQQLSLKEVPGARDDLQGNEPADTPGSKPQYESEKKLLSPAFAESDSFSPGTPKRPAATSNFKTVSAEITDRAQIPETSQKNSRPKDGSPESAMVNLHGIEDGLRELADNPPENSLRYRQFKEETAKNKAKETLARKMLAGQEKKLGASRLMDVGRGEKRLKTQGSASTPEPGRNSRPKDGKLQLVMANLHTTRKLNNSSLNKPGDEGLPAANPPENSSSPNRFNKQQTENKAKKIQKQKMLAGQEKNLGASQLMDAGRGKEGLSKQTSALNPELGRLKSMLQEGSNGTNPRWQEVLAKAFSHIEEYQQYQAGQMASGLEGAGGRENKEARLQQAARQLEQARNGLSKLAQEWLSPPKQLQGEGQAQSQQNRERELQQVSQQIKDLKGIFPQAEILSSQIKDIAWQLESPAVEPPDSLPFSSKGKALHSEKGMNSGKDAVQQATDLGSSLPPEEKLRKQALKRVNQFLDQMLFLLEGKQSASLIRDTNDWPDSPSQSSTQERGGRPQNPNPSLNNEYLFPGEGASKHGQSAQPLYLDERLAEESGFAPLPPANTKADFFNQKMARLSRYRRELGQPTSQRLSRRQLEGRIDEQASNYQESSLPKSTGKLGQDNWPASHASSFGFSPYQKRLPPKDRVQGTYPKQENLSHQNVFAEVVQRLRRVRERLTRTRTASQADFRPPVSALKRSRPAVQNRQTKQRPAKQPRQTAIPSERWKLTSYELTQPPRERVKKKSAIPVNTLVSFASGQNFVLWAEIPVPEGSNHQLDFSATLPSAPRTEIALNPVAKAVNPLGKQSLPHFYQPIIKQLFKR